MTIQNAFVLIGKVIVVVLFVGLMIWTRWTQWRDRYKGLNGYSPTLKLGDDLPAPDQPSKPKAGIVVEFRKEEHSQPVDQLGQFDRRKRKLRFSLKVSREKPDDSK